MKEEILHYFRHDRSHASGVRLVMKYSVKAALKRQCNLQPESEYLTGVVHEELRQLSDIPISEHRRLMTSPIVPIPVASPAIARAVDTKPAEEPSVPKAVKKNKVPGKPAKEPEKKAGRKK